MKSRPAVAFILLSIILYSCGKKTTVSGKVTNLFDGTTVNDLKVAIGYNNGKVGGIGGLQDAEWKTTRTNNDGEFRFEIRCKKSRKYYWNLPPEDYHLYDTTSELVKHYSFNNYKGSSGAVIIDRGGSQHLDLVVVPTARLKILQQDTGLALAADERVQLFIDDPDINEPDISGLFGFYSDIITKGELKLRWTILKNGVVQKEFKDNMALEPFTKKTYHLYY